MKNLFQKLPLDDENFKRKLVTTLAAVNLIASALNLIHSLKILKESE